MAEEASASSAAAGKMTMVVGVDDSEPSWYALRWTLHHFFQPGQPYLYRLVVVTAKPAAPCDVGLAGPGAADVVSFVEADLKRSSKRIIEKAKDLCAQLQVSDAVFEVVEGDARNVLCEAVERHHAEMLVVGSHGYGAIKRETTVGFAHLNSLITERVFTKIADQAELYRGKGSTLKDRLITSTTLLRRQYR